MNRKYQLLLNHDETEEVKKYLESHMGISLSRYLRLHLRDFLRVIHQSPALDKKPSEMTMQEFMDTVQHWFKKADDEK